MTALIIVAVETLKTNYEKERMRSACHQPGLASSGYDSRRFSWQMPIRILPTDRPALQSSLLGNKYWTATAGTDWPATITSLGRVKVLKQASPLASLRTTNRPWGLRWHVTNKVHSCMAMWAAEAQRMNYWIAQPDITYEARNGVAVWVGAQTSYPNSQNWRPVILPLIMDFWATAGSSKKK